MPENLTHTPTDTVGLSREMTGFQTILGALDRAALSEAGFNFHNGHGQLKAVLSFRDLRTKAQQLASRLWSAGAEKGDRIALPATTDENFIVAFFAALYAGIVPVPLAIPTAFGARAGYIEQVRLQLDIARPVFVLTSEDLLPVLSEVVDVSSATDIYSLLSLPQQDARFVPPAIRPEDLAYLQFSSGSTRFPTGIEITHANLIGNCCAINQFGVGVRWGDRATSWLPFFHDMGLVGFMLAPLASQTSVDYLRTEDFSRRPLTWLNLISQQRGTISYAPSFAYELCARRVTSSTRSAERALDLSCWRVAGIGGEMVRHQSLDGFVDAFAGAGFSKSAFCASYGLAETVLAVTFAPVGRGLRVDERRDVLHSVSSRVVSCGKVLPDHEVSVRSSANGANAGEGQIGRVFVRGPSVMRGYFGDPDATQRVLSNGWLDTGDFGYFREGELFLVGRSKDMLIINGRNVWPQDIEWAVESAEGLRPGDTAVIGAMTGDAADQSVILVQCRLSNPAERQRLAHEVHALAVRAAGAGQFRVQLVPPHSLPKTSSGKLARHQARQMFAPEALGVDRAWSNTA